MIAYFDTSAFTKLFVDEPGTHATFIWWEVAETVVVSLLLYPETRAAIARARRDGREVRVPVPWTGRTIDEYMDDAMVIAPTRRIAHHAGDLAEERALRGFDAVHLASALHHGGRTILVTGDKRLANAAADEGLTVLLAA